MVDTTEQVKQVYGIAAVERALAEQKTKLLPQIEKKRKRLYDKREEVQAEIDAAESAIAEIKAGRITDYAIRRRARREDKQDGAAGL